MNYFWDTLEKYGTGTALIYNDRAVSYEELARIADTITEKIPERSFVFLISRNRLASIAGYIGFLRKRIVPVLLSDSVDRTLFDKLVQLYKPQYIFAPEEFFAEPYDYVFDGYGLAKTGYESVKMNKELAVLIPTSGSTGSPKLVRLSYLNIQSNTESIVEYLKIVPEDKAITTLPMNYVYGLSIINTHLMAKASILLNEKTVFDRMFWESFKKHGATTFGAVPYIYTMLDKLHFLEMDLPSLRYITQAGGKLSKDLHFKIAESMRNKGKAFIVMYGASEASARMSYVPFRMSTEKAGTIGIAIPGGRFELVDEKGKVIFDNDRVGELVYYGPNVMLGYAKTREDLKKEDEMNGCLFTGDLAKRDEDGYYTIVGRKNRFLKVYGNRINLSEIEELLMDQGYEVACVGEDDHIRIYTTSREDKEIVSYIAKKTGLNPMAFTVIYCPLLPRNEAGKILYSKLK